MWAVSPKTRQNSYAQEQDLSFSKDCSSQGCNLKSWPRSWLQPAWAEDLSTLSQGQAESAAL